VRSEAAHRPLAGRDFAAVCALGVLSYYGASFLDFLALQYISAGLGRLLLFIYPTIVVVLSALLLGKRVTTREVAALVLTYGGLALVFAQSLDGGEKNLWLGALLAFASALCYAVYLVAGGEVIARVGSVRFTAYAMSAAALACILQWAILRPVFGTFSARAGLLVRDRNGSALDRHSSIHDIGGVETGGREYGRDRGSTGTGYHDSVRLSWAGGDHDAAAARRLRVGSDGRHDHQPEASQAGSVTREAYPPSMPLVPRLVADSR
jgi:hypothetical protein